MVLLLLTCCLLLLPLLDFVIVALFCCALLCVQSRFAIILMGKIELVALLFVFLMSPDCCAALPHGARVSLQFSDSGIT